MDITAGNQRMSVGNPLTGDDWSVRIPECEAMDDPAENAAYDHIATRWLTRAVYPALVREVALPTPQARVLDACSGSGRLSLALAKALPRATIVGVDLSDGMLDLARQHVAEAKLDGRVTFSRYDIARTGFTDDQFDAAVTYGALHHWSDPAAVFAELARVVRPGGQVLVGDWRRDPAPLRFFRSFEGTPEWQLIHASARAAYLEAEVESLLEPLAGLAVWRVERHAMGLLIRGRVLPQPNSPQGVR